jgi:hypothetical protein
LGETNAGGGFDQVVIRACPLQTVLNFESSAFRRVKDDVLPGRGLIGAQLAKKGKTISIGHDNV